MNLTLGEGLFQRLPLPEPEPQDTLLEQVLDAMTALRTAVLTLPAPQVTVQPQDLSDVVQAVQALNGPAGPTATEIALAIREVLLPSLTPPPQVPVAELVEALKQLDFRLKGVSGRGGSVGASSLTNDQLRASAVLVDTGDGVSRALTVATATVTSGSPLTVTPSTGKALRIWWVSAMPDPDNSTTGAVTATLVGPGEIYRSFAFAHRQRFDGDTDGTLTVAVADGTVEVTVHYEEI